MTKTTEEVSVSISDAKSKSQTKEDVKTQASQCYPGEPNPSRCCHRAPQGHDDPVPSFSSVFGLHQPLRETSNCCTVFTRAHGDQIIGILKRSAAVGHIPVSERPFGKVYNETFAG